MQIAAILRRWIETLATLYLAWRETQRERQAVTLAFERGQLVVRGARADGKARADIQPGQTLSVDAARAARNSFVVLELPPDRIVTRNITVPTQAEKFLAGVVHNQIDRLSPWPVGNLAYGFTTAAAADKAAVEVRILMASRADLEAARERLAVHGLNADRIVAYAAASEATGEGEPVTLWSRASDASGEGLADAARLVAVSVGGVVALTVAFSLWALASTGLTRSESEDLAARVKTLQQKVQVSRGAAGTAPPAERAWRAKESAIASVIVLEAVSRALPDSAYLTEIRLEGATLRLAGLASDVPGLLAPLEQSGHLAGVHFSAPATRGPEGKFRFSIEAQVEPRIKVAEE